MFIYNFMILLRRAYKIYISTTDRLDNIIDR